MSKPVKWILIGIGAPLGLALFLFIGAEVVMRLWNWLLPQLFGFPQVTRWQALGLLALCRILFGGHGFSSGGPGPGKRSKRCKKQQLDPPAAETA